MIHAVLAERTMQKDAKDAMQKDAKCKCIQSTDQLNKNGFE